MTIYKRFEPPAINPRNSGEVIAAAISSAYRLTAGNLRNFLPGSPLMVLIEALCFAHMELSHWEENLPEAYVLTLMSRVLGQGQNVGSYSQASILVTLTTALSGDFTIPAGAILLDANNNSNRYVTEEDLFIPAGSTSGFVDASAETVGPDTAVGANILNSFLLNFAYVASVTNPAPSSVGLAPETSSAAQDRIKAQLGARNPSSETDWQILAQEYFGPNTVSRIVKNYPGLSIYIKNLTAGPTLTAFEARVNLERNLFQQVLVAPYQRIGLDLNIRYTDSTPLGAECVEITQALNSFLEDFNGTPQPIDLYEEFVRITGNNNLAEFDVAAYELGTRFYSRTLEPYDFALGQIVLDSAGNYFESSADTNVIASPFDEAELGLLKYYPVLETFAGGFIEQGYVVKFGGLYYEITNSGQFTIGVNATLLAAPQTWAYGQTYDPTDFIYVPGVAAQLSHGFIPTAAYTSANDWQLSLNPIVPNAKILGDSVSVGEVWALSSAPAIIYRAGTIATITQTYVDGEVPQTLAVYPSATAVDHWLKFHSLYRIGTLDASRNNVYVSTDGAQKPVPSNIDTSLMPVSTDRYGSLFLEGQEVWEFISGSTPSLGDSSTTLPVKKATRPLNDFSFITYPEQIPYFLKLSSVAFTRGFANDPEKLVIESAPGVYTLA